MPEGDTLHRTADVLRAMLHGRVVQAARGRAGGPPLERLVGRRVLRVEAVGKHLLIGLEGGLTLHTHLRMQGAWHRYRSGERWRRAPSRAVAVLEVADGVAVCFDAPTVELLDSRALAIHPVLGALGPDLLADQPDIEAAVSRLRAPGRATMTVGEGLLDQSAVAGIGNVYRSEVLFVEGQDPFAHLGDTDGETLERVLRTAARLLRANVGGAARVTMPDAMGGPPGALPAGGRRERLWVYGRTARPCRRCGTPIRSETLGQLPRRLYWCPTCQPGVGRVPFGP